MKKGALKSTVMAASFGGLVYAIVMSLFYQFFKEEVFNIKKFAVDFIMFALIIAIVNIISFSRSKKNKDKS